MNSSRHMSAAGIGERRCAFQDVHGIRWWQDLPVAWKALVAGPVRLEFFQEYEMLADRTLGYDEHEIPCYCAFRFMLTALKSDDDEVFYEMPDYAETQTAWRLRDARWLVYRELVANVEEGKVRRFFSISDAMPR